MTVRDGAEDRDDAQRQKDAVQRFDERKRLLPAGSRAAKESAMHKRCFAHEERRCEERPYENHRVHPPDAGLVEALPVTGRIGSTSRWRRSGPP